MERWDQTFEKAFKRFFERQRRVVTEKLLGAKARRGTWLWDPAGTKTIDASAGFDLARWDKELLAEYRPIATELVSEVWEMAGLEPDEENEAFKAVLDERCDLIVGVNKTTLAALEAAIAREENADKGFGPERLKDARDAVDHVFDIAITSRTKLISENESIGAYNAGGYAAAVDYGEFVKTKTWLSAGDEKVRPTHRAVNGKTIRMDKKFAVGAATMDHPHSTGAPAEEVMRCRCTLQYGLEDIVDAEIGDLADIDKAKGIPWDDLKPNDARFSQARAKQLRKQLDDDGLGDFVDAVKGWQFGETDSIHKELRKLIAEGKDGTTRATALRDAIRNAPGDSPELFRGSFMKGGAETVAESFTVGDNIAMLPKSFSSEFSVADLFAGQQKGSKAGTKVYYRLEPKAKGVPVENLSETKALYTEKEFIVGGRMKVRQVTTFPDPENPKKLAVLVDIAQTGVY